MDQDLNTFTALTNVAENCLMEPNKLFDYVPEDITELEIALRRCLLSYARNVLYLHRAKDAPEKEYWGNSAEEWVEIILEYARVILKERERRDERRNRD